MSLFKFKKSDVKNFNSNVQSIKDTIVNNAGTGNPQIDEMISNAFDKNIKIDAARAVLDDWGDIQSLIKNDATLSFHYNEINKNELELSRINQEIDDFKISHQDLWFHGFENNSATVLEFKNKKKQYTNEGIKSRENAQAKFDAIFQSFVNSDNLSVAQKFVLMYDEFGKPNHYEQISFDNDTWSGWLGNIVNPYNKDLSTFTGTSTTDIQGPSYNKAKQNWEHNDTFSTNNLVGGTKMGAKADTPISTSYFNDIMNELDEQGRSLFLDFASDYNDLEKSTDNFNHLNQLYNEKTPHPLRTFTLGMLEMDDSEKARFTEVKNRFDKINSNVKTNKISAQNYINSALDIEIGKDKLNLGLLYTFEELTEEMNNAYELTREDFLNKGFDAKLVDTWYNNIKSGQITKE